MPNYGFEATGIELDPIGQWYLVKNGVATNFKQLGFNITSFNNHGMPPIDNVLMPLGLSGGSLSQRSVPTPRYLNLMGTIEGESYNELRRKRALLARLLSPVLYSQTPSDIAVRFLDPVGGGPALEMKCIYAGGLEGTVSNLFGETLTLQFIELQPPSVSELATTTVALNTVAGSDSNYLGAVWRDATGVWQTLTTLPTHELYYAPDNLLWYGTVYTAAQAGANVGNKNGVTLSTVTHSTPANAKINKILYWPSGGIVAAGNFTSPRAYIGRVPNTGGAMGAVDPFVASSFNGEIMDMAWGNDGKLYIVGKFTSPGNRVYIYDPNLFAWSTLGTGFNNDVNTVAKGLDGKMYFGGKFTTANGVAANGIAVMSGPTTAPVFSAMGTGITNIGSNSVDKIDVLPNGNMVIAGTYGQGSPFGIGNAVQALNIALWNGQQYSQVDYGLLGNVKDLAIDRRNGEIYISQYNYGTSDAPNFYSTGQPLRKLYGGVNKFNGVAWVSVDSNYNSAETDAVAFNSNTGEIAISDSTSTSGGRSYAAWTDVNYAGTAEVFPQLVLSPTNISALYSIINYTTGKEINFDYFWIPSTTGGALPGEVITMQFGGPDGTSMVSNLRGNVLGTVVGGSDVGAFSLVPGHNYIGLVMAGQFNNLNLVYKNKHWGFDGGL